MNDSEQTITFTLNGSAKTITTDPQRRLLDVLREDLALPGSKEGCGEGECGACSVVIDGRIINACIIPVGYVEGQAVDTIESIRESRIGQSLVDMFALHGAVQCGFCIPGMIVAGYSLLKEYKAPDEAEIREAISGNLCRCTGYDRIVAAIKASGESLAGVASGSAVSEGARDG